VCRTRASTSAAFNFNFSAASLNCAHTLAARTSSHVVSSTSINSASSKAGKSFSLIFSIISVTFVIPLATISFKTLSTSAAFILTFSASSFNLAHTTSPRTSAHLKFLAISTRC